MTVPKLPETWGSMTATQRCWWLHNVAGLPEVNWKRRTGRFHVFAFVPAVGCRLQTAGVRTLGEAVELRARLLAFAESAT